MRTAYRHSYQGKIKMNEELPEVVMPTCDHEGQKVQFTTIIKGERHNVISCDDCYEKLPEAVRANPHIYGIGFDSSFDTP